MIYEKVTTGMLQEGDQYRRVRSVALNNSNNVLGGLWWYLAVDNIVGTPVSSFLARGFEVRRAVPAYRTLSAEEVLQEGDEYLRSCAGPLVLELVEEWIPISKTARGHPAGYFLHNVFRRRIATTPRPAPALELILIPDEEEV